jgi:hypothetical protein
MSASHICASYKGFDASSSRSIRRLTHVGVTVGRFLSRAVVINAIFLTEPRDPIVMVRPDFVTVQADIAAAPTVFGPGELFTVPLKFPAPCLERIR